MRDDGTKYFVHGDHIGSSSLLSDESGNGVENSSFSPFGVALSGANESRYSYEGKEYDSAIDQYDFHFRGYKAEWGKFVQPDTLLQNVYDPQLLNRYSFERNNAWKNVDESGHIVGFVELSFAAVLGAVLLANVAMTASAGGGLLLGIIHSSIKQFMQARSNANLALSAANTANKADTYLKDRTEENRKALYKSFVALALNIAMEKIGGANGGADTKNIAGAIDQYSPDYYGSIVTFLGAVSSDNFDNTLVSIQHVYNNPRLSQDIKSSIMGSMFHTSASGKNIQWYYNPNTGHYQYWVGEGRPSDEGMVPMGGKIVKIGGDDYYCKTC